MKVCTERSRRESDRFAGRWLCSVALGAILLVPTAPGRAAVTLTDISELPLVTSTSMAVKPNLMYIMDTSGSMAWSFMPDTVGNNVSSNCFRNYIYNGVYYNPNYTYAVPVTYLGVAYAASSFTNAPYDGFNLSKGYTNLSSSFEAYDSTNGPGGGGGGGHDTAQAGYYYNYTGAVSAGVPNNTTCYANTNYTKVVVSATSGPGVTDERLNFANWYTYYRTRILFVKTSIGIAFQGLNTNYRLGFTNIYNSSWAAANSQFLPVADLTSTQKSSFYTTLYNQTPSGTTPLQGALYNVGQVFQKKIAGASDPIEYSCQKNFVILSTDGFWDASFSSIADTDGATSTVNGATVSPTPRPYYDGGYATSTHTLADVAYYFWSTDLRPAGTLGALGTDVSNNNVAPTATDPATWQHLDLFTVGLGANGVMTYISNYDTATTGDYYKILTNATTGCTGFNSDNKCNWPVPTSNTLTTIDDLWHAAVNGHGKYFNVKNPGSLADSFQQILSTVNATLGTDAAAATSNPNIVAGDNYLFESTFTSNYWYGDVFRQTISVNTGAVTSTDWSAQALLDARTWSARSIYMYSSSASNKLTPFIWANLSATQQGYFLAAKLSQYPSYSIVQAAAATGVSMVNFVRGDRTNEIDPNNSTGVASLYRTRQHVLGDIINAEAAYVGTPPYSYGDSGYAAFAASYTTTCSSPGGRTPAVYVGANDGMLHAFNACTGAEMWSYVPTNVIPNMWTLEDALYGQSHQYFVDGTPVTGDIAVAGAWKTILVGGFNAGARGYYALDITNPGSPAALWELTDTNMGYSFGNPVITKNAAGRWVVLLTSGYNNVTPGDGLGHFYVVDAATGTVLQNISTAVGSTSAPSGLSKITAWADDTTVDDTMLRAYGGDLLGNLWRFDPDVRIVGDGSMITDLATLKDPSGAAQPITTKPELGDAGTSGSSIPMVFVGTGKYLGTTDLTTTQVQTMYGIVDPLTTTGWGNVRANGTFVQQTLTDSAGTGGARVRTSSANAVNLTGGNNGWYVDLPDLGERDNTDPSLDLGILSFTTNVPNSDACTAGGYSWLNYLNYATGSYLASSPSNVSGVFLGNAIATRPVVLRLSSGKLIAITRGSDGSTTTTALPQASTTSGKRVSWREIFQ